MKQYISPNLSKAKQLFCIKKEQFLYLQQFYKHQYTEFEVNGCKREAKIRKAVRQVCALSPYVLNIFISKATIMLKE